MKFPRIITFLCSIVLCFSMAFAQSSGDKLYNQGLELQKTMTVSAQKQAIQKFTSAKKLYDSSAKKAQCDQAIKVSQGIISKLKSPSSDPNPRTLTVEDPTLDLPKAEFEIGQEGGTIEVTVLCNKDNWKVMSVSDGNSKDFATAKAVDDNQIEIYVLPNDSYEKRQQRFSVIIGSLHKEITITQAGIPVKLSVKDPVLKFKLNGNKKKTEVFCNSTMEYADNSGENWYVESKPDWIIVTINQQKSNTKLGGLLNKGKDLVEKNITGKDVTDDPDMRKTSITLEAMRVQKATQAAYQGRDGEVVLRSGDATVTIHVSQFEN